MNCKTVWLAALVSGWLLPGFARAQYYDPPKSLRDGVPMQSGLATPRQTMTPMPMPTPTVSAPARTVVAIPTSVSGASPQSALADPGDVVAASSLAVAHESAACGCIPPGPHCDDHDRFPNWDVRPRFYCCGPPSCKPAIQTELYFRTGPSFVLGDGLYGNSLETGWTFQGGAKAMFFNHYFDTAWYVDMSISNIHNSANNTPASATLVVEHPFGGDQEVAATIRGLNRTFVNLGLGRALYLWAPADSASSTWRVCWDGGGRWGSTKGDFFEITHQTEVIGGVYAGLQTDVDIPYKYAVLHMGVRLEYGYTWSDILQRASDVQDLSLLLELGLRF